MRQAFSELRLFRRFPTATACTESSGAHDAWTQPPADAASRLRRRDRRGDHPGMDRPPSARNRPHVRCASRRHSPARRYDRARADALQCIQERISFRGHCLAATDQMPDPGGTERTAGEPRASYRCSAFRPAPGISTTKNPRSWPPRDVVDRDLELAVSMFAPGAETVKERTIHTAIGVVQFQRRGGIAVEDPNPLGPPFRIGLCGNCQHVEAVLPDRPACPVCTAAAGVGDHDYRAIDLHQPKGFQSYYTKARDYDGSFDFVPRAARPKAGRPRFSTVGHLNFRLEPARPSSMS